MSEMTQKKSSFILIIVLTFVAGTIVSGSVAFAEDKKEDPLTLIVTAINNLSTTIANKQTSVNVPAPQVTVNVPPAQAGPQGLPGPKGDRGDPGPAGTIVQQSCSVGQVVTGFDSTGHIICNSIITPTTNPIGTSPLSVTISCFPPNAGQVPLHVGNTIACSPVINTNNQPNPLSGTLTWYLDGLPQTTFYPQFGIAQFTSNSLSIGAHTIGIKYSGDGFYTPSVFSFSFSIIP